MIPVLYSQSESDYGHNGIGILSDVIYYTVTEEANGEFELYLEYPVNGRLFYELKYQRLIKAKPNDLDEDHVFRIYEIVKDLESHMVYIYATSKTNDLGTNLVKTLDVQNKTAQEALNLLKTSLVEPTEFNFVSDITTRSSTYWEFRNPLSCIVGEDNSLVKYWGGEVKRTNDTVYLYSRRGRDNVTVLREGKNIKGLEFTVSTKGLVTKIVPYFIRYDEDTGEEIVTIGNTVSSPLVNNYPIVNIMPVDYTLWDELETAADLNAAASGYFTYQNPGVDKPKVSLDIDIMQLSESSQYKQYSNLESLIVFDSVNVYLPKFDVNVEVRVNRVVYNGLLERADTINCGDPISSLFDDVRRDYTELIGGTESKLINIVQKAAEGSASIFRGPDEPIKGMKPGDLWYKPVGGSDKEMYQWTGAYWELILNTKDINANKELVDTAIATAEQAKQVAESAYLDSVAEAERLIDEQTVAFDAEMDIRKGEIQEAKNQADLAVGKANSNAEAIFGKLDLSVYEANKTAVETELGKKLATATYTAQKQTQDALIAGKVALTTYNAKVSELNTAINGTSLRVDELEDGFSLTATKTEVDSLKTRMNTAELSITATSNQLALKASQTDLNAATGRLTTAEGRITANATAIELRATKTDVNALTGRVTTAEGTITAQAGQIALRATTATVNALTSRVSTAEASLVIQSGKIDLAATKSEVTTAIDGIEIGGRNLVKNTAMTTAWGAYNSSIVTTVLTADGTKATWGTTLAQSAIQSEIPSDLVNGEKYVIRLKARGTLNNFQMFILTYPTPNYNFYSVKDALNATNFREFTVPFTYNHANKSNLLFLGGTPSASGQWLEIMKGSVKLEKGNKATDWTPAPEDVETAYKAVSRAERELAEVNAKAYADGVVSAEEQRAITDTQAKLDEAKKYVDDLEIGGRNLLTSTGDLSSWSGVTEGSGEFIGSNKFTRVGFSGTGRAFAVYNRPRPKLIEGESYTLSAWIYVDSSIPLSGPDGFFIRIRNDTLIKDLDIANISINPLEKDKWVRVSAVGVVPNGYNSFIQLSFALGRNGLVYFKEVKLEKGNKATDWTPAPEDIDAAISTVQSNLTVEAGKITALTTRVGTTESNITNVTQTVSGINTTISTLRTDVNGKATIVSLNEVKSTADGNKTTISNHAGRLTTVETNVNGLQTTVASKASQTQVTQLSTSYDIFVGGVTSHKNLIPYWEVGGLVAATGEDYNVTDRIRTPLIVNPNVGRILGNTALFFSSNGIAVNMTYVVRYRADGSFYDTAQNVSSVTLTDAVPYCRISMTVATSNIPTNKYQLETGSVSSYVPHVGTASRGQVMVMQDNINLRVTKGDVMSQINIEAGRTLISTGKLYLDTGSTIMTTAYVNDLKAKSIEAVTANITSIRSQILVTDSVTSTHIKAENALIDTIFGTTALITRLTSKTAFISNIQAINISADKITSGTLNSTIVNAISLNVSQVTGLNSSFIQSTWNGLNSSLSIDSAGLKSYSSRLETRLTAGYVRYYIDNAEVGYMAPLVSTLDVANKAIGLVVPSGGNIILGRSDSGGVRESIHISGVDGTIGIKRPLDFSLGGVDVGKIYGHATNGLIISSSGAEIQFYQGGTALMYGVAGGLRMYRQINMNQNTIDNVASVFAAEVATPILRKVGTLATDSTLNFTRAGVTYVSMISGGFRMQIQLNMNTFDVTNVGKITYASDARYKSSIVTREVSDLDIIRNIRYVDYTFNRDGSRQRGLIAQELMNADSKLVTTSENGYLSYDSQQYTHAIGHGLQELDGNVRDLRDGVLRTNKDFLSKIEELENKIQQLEEKLA